MKAPLLTVDNVSKTYRTGNRNVAALKEVSLTIGPGETLGLAGPSGCGKSTLARVLVRLVPPDSGSVEFLGRDWLALRAGALRRARRDMQMVFQDSRGAFSPRTTVAEAIGDPLRIHGIGDRHMRDRDISKLLERVELPAACSVRPVLELSGGQRQRVAIARAIALRPSLIVLDEAVSALDVSVRRHILKLLVDIQKDAGTSYLFVSHDLAVIRAVSHRIAIMDAGRIIETGPTMDILRNPQSKTAKLLVDAVPRLFNSGKGH